MWKTRIKTGFGGCIRFLFEINLLMKCRLPYWLLIRKKNERIRIYFLLQPSYDLLKALWHWLCDSEGLPDYSFVQCKAVTAYLQFFLWEIYLLSSGMVALDLHLINIDIVHIYLNRAKHRDMEFLCRLFWSSEVS